MKAKKLLKCFMTMVIMIMAFAVTGTISNAEEEVYTPTHITSIQGDKDITKREVIVPANSYVVIPISIPAKGGMYLSYDVVGNDNLYGELYSDSAYTQSVTDLIDLTSEDWDESITLKKEGIYYLKIENHRGDIPLLATMSAVFIDGTDKTISSGKTYYTYQNDNTYGLHKFTATETGYINVYTGGGSAEDVYIKLLSSRKKALSGDVYMNWEAGEEKASFGVEKGKTYYLAIKAYSNEYYSIKYTLKKIKEKSGSKKSKAVTIKKNKTVKGIQVANNKKNESDWYKIKLTKEQKIKFYIGGNTTDDELLNIKIIPASGIKITDNIIENSYFGKITDNIIMVPHVGKITYETKNKLPKGTYYLQVYRANKKASGYYTIKWK